MVRTVVIQFDGQQIRTELPLPNLFTGNITLSFNWKEGKLLAASASKTSSAQISTDVPTLQRMAKGDIMDLELNNSKILPSDEG